MVKKYYLEHSGTIKHIIKNNYPEKITIRLILAWTFSLLFLLGGILNILMDFKIIKGILITLMGLILFPPIDKMMRNKYNFYLSAWLKLGIIIFLFFINAYYFN